MEMHLQIQMQLQMPRRNRALVNTVWDKIADTIADADTVSDKEVADAVVDADANEAAGLV